MQLDFVPPPVTLHLLLGQKKIPDFSGTWSTIHIDFFESVTSQPPHSIGVDTFK
jgi:hypothetical protein